MSEDCPRPHPPHHKPHQRRVRLHFYKIGYCQVSTAFINVSPAIPADQLTHSSAVFTINSVDQPVIDLGAGGTTASTPCNPGDLVSVVVTDVNLAGMTSTVPVSGTCPVAPPTNPPTQRTVALTFGP